MREIRVDKILPEHVGWEVYGTFSSRWLLILCVDGQSAWVKHENGGHTTFDCENNEGWLIRNPAEKEEHVHSAMCKCYRPNQKKCNCSNPKPSERIEEMIGQTTDDVEYRECKLNAIVLYLDELREQGTL